MRKKQTHREMTPQVEGEVELPPRRSSSSALAVLKLFILTLLQIGSNPPFSFPCSRCRCRRRGVTNFVVSLHSASSEGRELELRQTNTRGLGSSAAANQTGVNAGVSRVAFPSLAPNQIRSCGLVVMTSALQRNRRGSQVRSLPRSKSNQFF